MKSPLPFALVKEFQTRPAKRKASVGRYDTREEVEAYTICTAHGRRPALISVESHPRSPLLVR